MSHALASSVGLALISSSLNIMQGKCFSVCVHVCGSMFVPVHACVHGLNQLIHLNVWFDLFANCQFSKREHQF